MTIPTCEKIETIVLAYLHHGSTSGAFGTLVEVPAFTVRCIDGDDLIVPSSFRVIADERTFNVRTTQQGWCVQRGQLVGVDGDLLEAARLVMSAPTYSVSTVRQAFGIAD
jgi:hypothetical protein